MIETERITNFILLIKEELRENMSGILAMAMGVLAALYTIWLTLTYLPAEPFPSVITPTPITPAPSYLLIAALLALAFIFFSLIVNKLLYGPSADGERKFQVSFQEKTASLAYSDVDTTFPLSLAGLKDLFNDRSKKVVEIKELPPAIANSFHIAIHLCVGTIPLGV